MTLKGEPLKRKVVFEEALENVINFLRHYIVFLKLIHLLKLHLTAGEPLFRGHPQDRGRCPLNRGVP